MNIERLVGRYVNSRNEIDVVPVDDRYMPYDSRGEPLEHCTLTASQMSDWLLRYGYEPTVRVEELARDKQSATAATRSSDIRIADYARMAAKYIAEVERLREDLHDAGVLIERKDAEIARLTEDYQRLFDQATAEVARLRRLGGQMANICYNLSQFEFERPISDKERASMRGAYGAWDEALRLPTPKLSAVSSPTEGAE